MQKLKAKSQNWKWSGDAACLLSSVFCLLSSLLLFGCSASEPPVNPYSCPTAPGYTLPDYCKPNSDPLATTSVGEAWVVPYVYYLYSANPTNSNEYVTLKPQGILIDFYLVIPPDVFITDLANSPLGYRFGDVFTEDQEIAAKDSCTGGDDPVIFATDTKGTVKTWCVKDTVSDKDATGSPRSPLIINLKVNGIEKPPTNYRLDGQKITYTLDADDEALTEDTQQNQITVTYYKRNAPPSFNTENDTIYAEYDPGTTTPPSIEMGVFAFDPDGTQGNGLDVTMSFLATDKEGANVGILQSSTNLLPNGAGKKIKWLASHATNSTIRLDITQDYTITFVGFDNKNNTFSKQFKVKLCDMTKTTAPDSGWCP